MQIALKQASTNPQQQDSYILDYHCILQSSVAFHQSICICFSLRVIHSIYDTSSGPERPPIISCNNVVNIQNYTVHDNLRKSNKYKYRQHSIGI